MTVAKLQPLGVYLASADLAEITALRLLCGQQEALRVVGAAVDVRGVLANILDSQVDLLLLDWELPHCLDEPISTPVQTTAQLIPYLRSRIRNLTIIVLTLEPRYELAALEAGADRIISKGDPSEKLLSILQQTINGINP